MIVWLGKFTDIDKGIKALARCRVGAFLDIHGFALYRDLIRQKLIGIKYSGVYPYPPDYETVVKEGNRITLTDVPSVKSIFIDIPSPLKRLVTIIERSRFRGYVYIVGGYVRDYLLGEETKDIDMVVKGNFREFIEIISQIDMPNLRFYPLGVKFTMDDYNVDISFSRYDFYVSPGKMPVVVDASISEDLERRDFTIGSLAYLIYPYFGLLDPFNGLQDLEEKKLRFIRGYAPFEDPSRILRGIRYSYILGMEFEDRDLQFSMQAASNLLYLIISRRFFKELEKLISCVGWDNFMVIDRKWGILKSLTGDDYDIILRHINYIDSYEVLKFIIMKVYEKHGIHAGYNVLGFTKRERKLFNKCMDHKEFIRCVKEGKG